MTTRLTEPAPRLTPPSYNHLDGRDRMARWSPLQNLPRYTTTADINVATGAWIGVWLTSHRLSRKFFSKLCTSLHLISDVARCGDAGDATVPPGSNADRSVYRLHLPISPAAERRQRGAEWTGASGSASPAWERRMWSGGAASSGLP